MEEKNEQVNGAGVDLNQSLTKLKNELIDKFNLLKIDMENRLENKLNEMKVENSPKPKTIAEMDENELPTW